MMLTKQMGTGLACLFGLLAALVARWTWLTALALCLPFSFSASAHS